MLHYTPWDDKCLFICDMIGVTSDVVIMKWLQCRNAQFFMDTTKVTMTNSLGECFVRKCLTEMTIYNYCCRHEYYYIWASFRLPYHGDHNRMIS